MRQRRFKRMITRALASCLLAFLVCLNARAETTIYLTNGEWPPYLSRYLPENGFASALVSAAFAEVGIKVAYEFYPWKRAYEYAENRSGKHRYQGSIVWLHTPERDNAFYFSAPVLTENRMLYYLKAKPVVWEQIEDLRGLVIGGTAHTAYKLLEKAQDRELIRLERAGSYDILFDRLLALRVDAVPQATEVAKYFLQTNYTKQLRDKVSFHPTPIDRSSYHLILNRQDPQNRTLILLFNQGLAHIKRTGTYAGYQKKLTTGYFYQPQPAVVKEQ